MKPPSRPQPPARSSSVRKQILRQAVASNVEVKEGRPSTVKGPQTAGGRKTTSRWLMVAMPVVVLLVSTAFVVTRSMDGRAITDPDRTRASHDRSAPEPLVDPADLIELPKPRTSEAELTKRLDPDQPIFQQPPTRIDPDVFPLEVRKIVLDPGHGGEDSGTHADEMSEKELTLDIALRLEEQLKADGFEVELTRRDDSFVSLRERAAFANEQKADLFISIHINWIVDRAVRGLETYFLGATDDPYLNALARRENRQSGYSLADMRNLLEGIYTDVRRDESSELASAVQRSLLASLRRDNPHLENRGVKTAPFVVLVATEMPAILAEVSCLSNRDEAELLARPLYREHIARAMSRGIRRYADDVNQIEQKGS
ncbi:MAG: N-acetylmuramoyl-L-alanine amidase [Thermoanaerobaculia bacterium]|nr:N-acetylmuramoyl-L-alanine amidase [Thermoanaerobaculia bacterium]